jgi:MFS family permease
VPPLALELALAIAVAVAFADSSIVVLALPELYVELETTIVGVSWIITAYNVAVVAALFALLPFVRRTRPAWLAVAGLAVFFGASIACAAAGGLGPLVAGRVFQGLGAALLLSASLPLLVALTTRDRGIATWVLAGTLGAAAGPALGGALTEAFDWRAIFIVQAPVAAAALVSALAAPSHPAPPHAPRVRLPLPTWSGLLLVLAFAALVGALFLAVILVVTVWDLGPLAGAGVVSALPLAALLIRPVGRELPARLEIGAGSALLAAGLVALAFLPSSSTAYATLALALAGAGLGLALPPLTRASLRGQELGRAGVYSVGVRHLGLVVGLLAVAPLLAADLERGGDRATLNATAVVLDAQLPLSQKIPIALDLYRAFQRTPEGEIPDLAEPFDRRGAGGDPDVRRTRDDLLDAVEGALTRAFRSSFALSAGFALLAAAAAVALRRERLA